MNKEHLTKIEQKLGELNSTLRKECINTKLITIEQWNAEIAPKLSELSMAIQGVTITARTYKLPESYFGGKPLPPNPKK